MPSSSSLLSPSITHRRSWSSRLPSRISSPHYATLCHIIYVCITLSSSFQTLPHSQKHHCASILYRSQRKLQKQNGNIHYQGTLATGPSNKSKSSLFRSFASLSTFPILFYLSRFLYLRPFYHHPKYLQQVSNGFIISSGLLKTALIGCGYFPMIS